jgi:type I restriction enzyme R subunit
LPRRYGGGTVRSARQVPDEKSKVEASLIAQLVGLGWSHVQGDIYSPAATGRTSFHEVLLLDQVGDALRRLNLDDRGDPWLDDARINDAISQLTRAAGPGGLVAANQVVRTLLVEGITVEGHPVLHAGRDVKVKVIDFSDPSRNEFTAINQFRVDPGGTRAYIVPDIVGLVNGIPLVVVECKSPAETDPMDEAVDQLLRYSNQRHWIEADEGVERLFHFNAVMVASSYYDCRLSTVGAQPEHYRPWKDVAPLRAEDVKAAVGVDALQPQHTLTAGALTPAHLLDLVQNFTVYEQVEGRLVKKVARYQQFRAVHRAIHRLLHPLPASPGGEPVRGGVVWHTQGSGKSLTMVFLLQKLRNTTELRDFKVVAVTDRRDLEKQLAETAALAGETVDRAKDTKDLLKLLAEPGAGLVFAMVQKYRVAADEPERLDSQEGPLVLEEAPFPVCNTSERVVVLVDEGHRTHTKTLHANLQQALPNAARIAFTGTPILLGEKKKTEEIFGPFIDTYAIIEAEADGAIVPIKYEGREATVSISDPAALDAALEEAYPDAMPEELEAIKSRYVTATGVRQAPKPIEAKAADLLRHYVDVVLPNGFKAQVVAATRVAAVRYRNALASARDALCHELDGRAAEFDAIPDEELAELEGDDGFLARAWRHRELLGRLDVAAVISERHNQDPALNEWSNTSKIETRIERFKRALGPDISEHTDPLAILCVKNMLLTGFDAPVEQVLYVDRKMQGAELLQAIARVNRTATGKTHGLVVDYAAIGTNLTEALAVYASGDVQGAMTPLEDELPKLADRHTAVANVFTNRGVASIDEIDECVMTLADARVRAEFSVKLRLFLQSLDAVLHLPQARPYVRDAKVLGFISKAAANLYRDRGAAILGAGRKVQTLIDAHLEAHGIDVKVEPISVLDAGFDDAVRERRSARAKASEMEHAARHHIDVHFDEDPARFRKLSERLQAILDQFSEDWDALVDALQRFIEELR